jgi:hypothetical protein
MSGVKLTEMCLSDESHCCAAIGGESTASLPKVRLKMKLKKLNVN